MQHENKRSSVTKTRFRKEIGRIRTIIREFNKNNEQLGLLFGRNAMAENVFLEQMDLSVGLAIDYLSELSGDKDKWVKWFIYDCDFCKRSPAKVTVNGKEFRCTGAGDLWDIIQEAGREPSQ